MLFFSCGSNFTKREHTKWDIAWGGLAGFAQMAATEAVNDLVVSGEHFSEFDWGVLAIAAWELIVTAIRFKQHRDACNYESHGQSWDIDAAVKSEEAYEQKMELIRADFNARLAAAYGQNARMANGVRIEKAVKNSLDDLGWSEKIPYADPNFKQFDEGLSDMRLKEAPWIREIKDLEEESGGWFFTARLNEIIARSGSLYLTKKMLGGQKILYISTTDGQRGMYLPMGIQEEDVMELMENLTSLANETRQDIRNVLGDIRNTLYSNNNIPVWRLD